MILQVGHGDSSLPHPSHTYCICTGILHRHTQLRAEPVSQGGDNGRLKGYHGIWKVEPIKLRNGGQEEGKVGAGGGPLICAGILIVLSASDEGDESQNNGLIPPSGNGCAMICESQGRIRFQRKILHIKKWLRQNYWNKGGGLIPQSSESPFLRIGLLWSCSAHLPGNFFNPCWDASRFVLHPSTERGIFTPDAGPDLTQRAKKILSKTLHGASGVRDPCAIAD